MGDGGSRCGGATALSGRSSSGLIFAGKRRVLTKATVSMRSGHCDGGIGSSDESSKVAKVLLFLLLNRLADPLDVELLEL